ncbi:MAG: uroporphyrinogen decarboxylase family protein, partial [Burkholderiales bacterium]
MDRRQRLAAAIGGGVPDRVPVSAWGHFFNRENSAASLADVMVEFFERYQWDYLKVHARASYHVEGWGFTYRPSNNPGAGHVCTGHPIVGPQSWRNIKPLSLDTPALAEQFDALARIRARIASDVPLIMTVFSPLDVAEKLVDRDAALLKSHIEADPDALAGALEAIADTLHRFVARLPALGVDGIYFSTKWANNIKLTPAQYQRLVRPYDLRVLEAAQGLWCNMLHLCEDAIQLEAMADYPVQVFHWDAHTPHNPGFAAGARVVGRAVGGGVDAGTLASGAAAAVYDRVRDAITQMNGRNLLVGPGCSVQVARTPAANLEAMR